MPFPIRYTRSMLVALMVWSMSPASGSAQTQDDFFSDDVVQDVRLTLSSRDWQTLKARAYEDIYFPADLRWRGLTVRNIGIRSRGFGSRNGIKPGLRVDINRYLANQEFLGLKAFVLDNGYTDASLLRESVTMRLFAHMGLPAPREAHARLFVNDEYAGAYVIVESIDRTFVSRVFGATEAAVETGGHLFEYRWTRPYNFEYLGPLLESYAELFKAQTRDTDSMVGLYAPFEDLIRTVNESTGARFASEVGRFLDLPAFVRFLAVQSFLAEIDGFVGNWGMNHVYLYRFRQNKPAHLIPWDADQAFSSAELPIDYHLDNNVLTRRVMEVPELRRLYLDTLLQSAALSEQAEASDPRGWLEREIDRQASQIASTVASDPVVPFSFDQFEADVAALLHFARARPAYVRCEATRADDPSVAQRTCVAADGTAGLRRPKSQGKMH